MNFNLIRNTAICAQSLGISECEGWLGKSGLYVGYPDSLIPWLFKGSAIAALLHKWHLATQEKADPIVIARLRAKMASRR